MRHADSDTSTEEPGAEAANEVDCENDPRSKAGVPAHFSRAEPEEHRGERTHSGFVSPRDRSARMRAWTR